MNIKQPGTLFVLMLACLELCSGETSAQSTQLAQSKSEGSIRVATFNISFNRPEAGALTRDLYSGHPQISRIAAIIRAVRPDILLLNEIDFAVENNAKIFAERYLADSKMDLLGGTAWTMPFQFSDAVNTGLPSGLDLNQDGKLGSAEDSWGFGAFPGQYGMAVLSRFEIDATQVRTFQNFLWANMPGARRPKKIDSTDFYPDDVWSKLRLPSKSFWDVPIRTPWGLIHVLASHPTPPAFDGPEDRNGCRNHDEIRLISDYLASDTARYMTDDRGTTGGMAAQEKFVILGDLNSDPSDGNSQQDSIRQLLVHPRVSPVAAPTSHGAVDAAREQQGANTSQRGKPSEDTADFSDRNVGNLRVDYVLPSREFAVAASGVVWPAKANVAHSDWPRISEAVQATDHRLVWMDIVLPRTVELNGK